MGDSARNFLNVTATAPSAASFRATSPGGASQKEAAILASAGLSAPGPLMDPRYLEHGSSYVAPPALATASNTAAAAGGAPGAQFGGPGVGGAPVITTPTIFGLSPLVLGVLVIGGAYLAYRVLR
jgi:hypothetical protein